VNAGALDPDGADGIEDGRTMLGTGAYRKDAWIDKDVLRRNSLDSQASYESDGDSHAILKISRGGRPGQAQRNDLGMVLLHERQDCLETLRLVGD
jgi:hypothetical protein